MWLPFPCQDESLYSRIIRALTLSGMLELDYLLRNFRKSRVSIHPYLTIGSSYVSGGFAETIDETVCNQTLIKLFSYYLPTRATIIEKGLLNEDCGTILRACNLASFKETEVLDVKYCPKCAKEDVRTCGFSYWHISHQIPGVESCCKHPVRLKRCNLPERTHIKRGFLPPYDTKEEVSDNLTFSFAQFSSSIVFSEIINNQAFNLEELKKELVHLGYILQSGTVKNKALTSDLLAIANQLNLSDGMIESLKEEKHSYIYNMFNGSFTQHPFKYLLIKFLITRHPTITNFKAEQDKKGNGKDQVEICLKLLRQNLSIAKVSKISGRSRCYLKALASKNEIPITVKPRQITVDIRHRTIILARMGYHRREISKRLNISSGSVEQIISTQPRLVDDRKRYRFESKRRRYRAEMTRYMKSNPNAIKQVIKNACYSAFHWLYRNDKTWLNVALPAPTAPKFYYRIDWSKRDSETVSKITKIMNERGRFLSLTKLDEALGGHGWLLKKSNKMPLTMKAYALLSKGNCK